MQIFPPRSVSAHFYCISRNLCFYASLLALLIQSHIHVLSQDGSSFFNEGLQKWRELNLSADFSKQNDVETRSEREKERRKGKRETVRQRQRERERERECVCVCVCVCVYSQYVCKFMYVCVCMYVCMYEYIHI